jgi:acyl transferase domain-containing protein/thioesterase domain-containing protein
VSEIRDNDIAIVGMAARVTGAKNLGELWRNLRDGVESIVRYTDEELLAAGESPENLRAPSYVKAGGPLPDMEQFDGEFFGFSPKECAIVDPQHRQFLECAWEALENAGHPPEKLPGSIGVFAGSGMAAYFFFNVCTNKDLVESVGMLQLRLTGNDKDFLASRLSYVLDLRGPSVNVQTGQSTSLVAVHVACRSLLSGECDLAIAGGVTIEIPHRRGYFYREGEVLSPDGHCHAFDHRARGTVFGSGTGVVVLRRSKDALRDGDHIHAVIKGSAVNNDGGSKAGWLAPSVEGQAAVMAKAYEAAGVSADTIGYVECHGTGTYVGDPIEIAALTKAFRRTTAEKRFCRVGSVKTNLGHLDTAAGVAGLIKASLALSNGQIPATLNFEKPNPTIDFESSPFIVNDRLHEWPRGDRPRRAAVNSLGIGGTNAHLVLEEAPDRGASSPPRSEFQLLTLSARSKRALDEYQKKLAAHLLERRDQPLADVAFTLHHGRRAFEQRRVIVARDHDEAARLCEANDPQTVFTHSAREGANVVFMFPGGGSQYPRMAADLYAAEPVYREDLDRGLALLKEQHGLDLRPLLFPSDAELESARKALEHPHVQLPAVFIVSHALAKLWEAWGVKPSALIGHSLGENVAACISGVISYPDAIRLVALRGRLVEQAAPGAMLSIPIAPSEIEPLLNELGLDLAIVNGPELCVASGTKEAIDALEKRLLAMEIEPRRIKISVAGHSRLLDPILKEFGDCVRSIPLSVPSIPFVSNRTGKWITNEQATDPEYWVQHLRHTIRFAEGVETLLETPGRVFLEVGPGRILSSLVRQHPDMKQGQASFSSLRHPDEKASDVAYFIAVFGRLWAAGAPLDLSPLWSGERRLRVELPTYAFQHQKYFIEPGRQQLADDLRNIPKTPNLEDWFYRPLWKHRPPELIGDRRSQSFLFFMDDGDVGRRLADRVRGAGHSVIEVHEGDSYARKGDSEYVLSPEHGREGYDRLIHDLMSTGKVPTRIAHLWMLTKDESFRPGSSFFHRNQECGFYSLFFLAQALASESAPRPLHVTVVSNGMQQVASEGLPYPEKATLLGPAKVIPREMPGITVSSVDVELEDREGLIDALRALVPGAPDPLVDQLEKELFLEPKSGTIAIRGGTRYEQDLEKRRLSSGSREVGVDRLRPQGTYFITGGLGGLGLVTAEYLAKKVAARLVLLGRSILPERSEWDSWLKRHPAEHPTSRRIRGVRAIEAAGGEVMIVSADVTDLEAVREAIAAAKQRFGKIHGLFHAAGISKDELIVEKALADAEDVFTPKVHGTKVLETAFAGEDLDLFVLYSSASTVVAPPGQCDYVAANAFLNAFAEANSAEERAHFVSINWGIWSEVGMTAEALAGNGVHRKNGAGQERPTTHPLFDHRTKDTHEKTILSARWSTETHWIANEHRTLAGYALIPGAGFLELARAALEEYGEHGPFEIEDLFFFRPLHVSDKEPKEIRARLERSERGYSFEVRSRRQVNASQWGWELHAQANLLLTPLPAPPTVDLNEIGKRCHLHKSHEDPSGIRSKQEQHLRVGPRWRSLRRVAYGSGEALARLELAEHLGKDLDHYGLHPALLDLGGSCALPLIEGYSDRSELWVPVSYGRVKVRDRLPRKIWSWAKNHLGSEAKNGLSSDFAGFDLVITDDQGRVLLEVEALTFKRMTGEATFGPTSEPSAKELELEESKVDSSRPLSARELQLQRNSSRGILPKEGAEVLDRVLSALDQPQVIVSSMDLAKLIQQVERTTTESAEPSAKFARPELESNYLAPRDQVERTLVGFWEELLGVTKVGVKDNFFDLGGHSLIAVRLFAMIKKTYQVDYPMSVLFEAPTIERCAAMIKEAIGWKEGSAPQPAAHRPRYTHLVAMHQGEGGPRTPFFMIAGMFGNVLNLRHLAHLIGTDRPFYGLQARGLYGDHEPHETFEEMARDYIAEMRSVQPRGPYFIGGFSGGGITGWEIARQLRAAGEETGLLVLLDTRFPHPEPITKKDKAVIHLQRLKKKGPNYVVEWADSRAKWEIGKLKKRFSKEVVREQTEFHNEKIRAAFERAIERYEVRPHPGKVTLFRPKLDKTHVLGPDRILSSDLYWVHPDNNWGRFAAAVEVHEVPGDHDTIVLEPNVRVLAARLRACIEKAEAEIKQRARTEAIARAQGGGAPPPGDEHAVSTT